MNMVYNSTPTKVKAILVAPTPHDVFELRSFLNYYGKFLPNLSYELSPLYFFLQNSTPWKWGPEQEKSLKRAKDLLSSPRLLVHNDPKKKLLLACDVLAYSLWAVLAHKINGKQQLISFVSGICLHSKTKYLQLDKEALGIRCIRFHQYLYGRKFVLYTDHKPLTHIFNPSRSIPQVFSSRLQCWSLVERIVIQSFIVQARITQMLMPWDISLSQIPLRLFLSLAIATFWWK